MQGAYLDGFPASGDAIHDQLTEDLRGAHDRRRTNASVAHMFPRYWAAVSGGEDARAWFHAALERLDWHLRHPNAVKDERESWAHYLAFALRAGLSSVPVPLKSGTFALIVKHASRIDVHHHEGPGLAYRAIRADPAVLSAGVVAPLLAWVDELARTHAHGEATYGMAFHLYRARFVAIPWAAADIREFTPLLDLASYDWLQPAVDSKRAKKLTAAITRLGKERVWGAIDHSVRGLESIEPSIALTAAGMTLLRQLLHWLQVEAFGGQSGQALYRICRLRWARDEVTRMLMKEWLGTLLHNVTLQGPERAVACAEMLAHNPDTKEYAEVSRLHEQLMTEAMAGVPGAAPAAVDGFPVQGGMHDVISTMLAASRPVAASPYVDTVPGFGTGNHVDLAFRRGQADLQALLDAMNQRAEWLCSEQVGHRPFEPPALFWTRCLGGLYQRVLATIPSLSRDQLIQLCRIDATKRMPCGLTERLVELVSRHIAEQGYEPRLTATMRAWEKSIHGGGATAMTLRKRIGRLLWFAPESPGKEARCWSALVRRDLQDVTPKLRAAWIEALSNLPGTFATAAPTKKWLGPARKLLDKVGKREFCTRVRSWFEPFRGGAAPLRITTAGRDVLGVLLWYSVLAGDEKDHGLNEALAWFGQAKWKTQADIDKIAMLAPVWIYALGERLPPGDAVEAVHAFRDTGQLALFGKSVVYYASICARAGRAPQIAARQPDPADAQEFLRKRMDTLLAWSGGPGVVTDGQDAILVTHSITGERYEISREDGRMVRLSDGKAMRIEIDWSRPEWKPFQAFIDRQDVTDPFGPNHFRLLLCVQVLSGAFGFDVPIVADDD